MSKVPSSVAEMSTADLLKYAQERARIEGLSVKTGAFVAPSVSVETKSYSPKSKKTGAYTGVFIRQGGEMRDVFLGAAACRAMLTILEKQPMKFREALQRGAEGKAGFTFTAG